MIRQTALTCEFEETKLPVELVENASVGRCTELLDIDLPTSIRKALKNSGYLHLRRVRCVILQEGHVRLEGSVSSFYLKQIAQTTVLSVDGVDAVENVLRVGT